MSSSRNNPLHEEEEVQLSAAQERTRRDELRVGARRGYSAAPELFDEESQRGGGSGRASGSRGRERLSMQEHQLAVVAFVERQVQASSRCRQLPTLSTAIILAQIGLLLYIIQTDGIAPLNENPTYGPSAYALVDFGAKQAGLIVYKGEWWRLITPIFLHAGVVHIVMNVYLQWQLGGYLYLLFGSVPWTVIYFVSGVYGNILSCIADPDTVGVGSSGALMGILSSFAVFLIFTWNKFPEDWRTARNCNLFSAIFAMTITMLLSMVEFIDGAAHGGGLMAGALAAMCLLAGEQDGFCIRWFVRLVSLFVLLFIFAYSLDYLYTEVHPSREVMNQYWQGGSGDGG